MAKKVVKHMSDTQQPLEIKMMQQVSTTADIAVFVYGTLMRGQRAAHMLEQYEYVGEFILKDYALYNVSYYPGIKFFQGATTIGEVYLVDDACISRMDEYESEGSLYIRKLVNVENTERCMEAYVYVYNRDVSGPVIEGKWIGK